MATEMPLKVGLPIKDWAAELTGPVSSSFVVGWSQDVPRTRYGRRQETQRRPGMSGNRQCDPPKRGLLCQRA